MLKMDLELKKSKQKEDVLFVRLKGNLTKGGIDKIYHYLIPVIKHHRIPNLIINFKDVNKIDELGVDSILKIKCLSKGISKIYLCSLKDYHEKILKRLHLKVYPKEKAIKKELMV